MKIIVCIKQVLDTAAKIEIQDQKVVSPGSPLIMNPYDEFAVEEAIRIKTALPESEIIVFSLGPDSVKETLKRALAMGADQAVHISDPLFEGLDNSLVAKVLAKAIQRQTFDLVLCGRQAVDDDMAQIGPALAVLLEIPFITVVTQLQFSEDFQTADITRQVEGGSEIRKNRPLPFLVTCQKGLNEPRLPSLKGIMAAKKKEIQNLAASDLGLNEELLDPRNNKLHEVKLSLPPERKQGIILEGSDEDIAKQLATIIREEEKII
ncbi:MAG: electron transfer flavoprotein subunit beta/FixA family protein [Nitrospina sp.]|jgi:electron transfer flavoprotein beta subunit|nr:electron transfer flavoprotein subunit beta/FixA family protein [Nitrospina sp.]